MCFGPDTTWIVKTTADLFGQRAPCWLFPKFTPDCFLPCVSVGHGVWSVMPCSVNEGLIILHSHHLPVCSVNPFTTTTSNENGQCERKKKVRISFTFFFLFSFFFFFLFFALACEKIFIKTHSIESRCAIGPEARPSIFQPGNVTCWSSEGVNIIQAYTVMSLKPRAAFSSVQFHSLWYLCARKSRYSLHPVSQRFQFPTLPLKQLIRLSVLV